MWNTLAVAEQGSSGAFVGRVAELERLEAALAALPERGAATVLVGGDAGSGPGASGSNGTATELPDILTGAMN